MLSAAYGVGDLDASTPVPCQLASADDDLEALLAPRSTHSTVSIDIDKSQRRWTSEWTRALSFPADTHERAVKRLQRMRQVCVQLILTPLHHFHKGLLTDALFTVLGACVCTAPHNRLHGWHHAEPCVWLHVLPQIVQEFTEYAVQFAKRIVDSPDDDASRLHSAGGIAGGLKYLENNIILKFSKDSSRQDFRLYGGNDEVRRLISLSSFVCKGDETFLAAITAACASVDQTVDTSLLWRSRRSDSCSGSHP